MYLSGRESEVGALRQPTNMCCKNAQPPNEIHDRVFARRNPCRTFLPPRTGGWHSRAACHQTSRCRLALLLVAVAAATALGYGELHPGRAAAGDDSTRCHGGVSAATVVPQSRRRRLCWVPITATMCDGPGRVAACVLCVCAFSFVPAPWRCTGGPCEQGSGSLMRRALFFRTHNELICYFSRTEGHHRCHEAVRGGRMHALPCASARHKSSQGHQHPLTLHKQRIISSHHGPGEIEQPLRL